MRIRTTVSLVGPEWSGEVGEEREVSDEEARRLIEAGYAEALTASVQAPRNAMRPKPRARVSP